MQQCNNKENEDEKRKRIAIEVSKHSNVQISYLSQNSTLLWCLGARIGAARIDFIEHANIQYDCKSAKVSARDRERTRARVIHALIVVFKLFVVKKLARQENLHGFECGKCICNSLKMVVLILRHRSISCMSASLCVRVCHLLAHKRNNITPYITSSY